MYQAAAFHLLISIQRYLYFFIQILHCTNNITVQTQTMKLKISVNVSLRETFLEFSRKVPCQSVQFHEQVVLLVAGT